MIRNYYNTEDRKLKCRKCGAPVGIIMRGPFLRAEVDLKAVELVADPAGWQQSEGPGDGEPVF